MMMTKDEHTIVIEVPIESLADSWLDTIEADIHEDDLLQYRGEGEPPFMIWLREETQSLPLMRLIGYNSDKANPLVAFWLRYEIVFSCAEDKTLFEIAWKGRL